MADPISIAINFKLSSERRDCRYDELCDRAAE